MASDRVQPLHGEGAHRTPHLEVDHEVVGTAEIEPALKAIDALVARSDTRPGHRARLLHSRAMLLDRLGRIDDSRESLLAAADAARQAGDLDLCARIALDYAIPSDWVQPSLAGLTALKKVARTATTPDQVALTRSARSMVELRVPSSTGDEGVLRWRSQPTIARRLAAEAIEAASQASPLARAASALAWRATHRAPEFLDDRRRRAEETFVLAHDSGVASLQVEAAVWRTVDALEQGDGDAMDEVIALGRWVAEESGSPRSLWRIAIAEHTVAFIRDEHERGERLRHEIAAHAGVASAFSASWQHLFFEALWQLDRGEIPVGPDEIPDEFPILQHPIGMAMVAEVAARTGDRERAQRLIDTSLQHLDPESAYLFQLGRLARAVCVAEDPDRAKVLLGLLEPWNGTVAVDSDAWGCEPPVSLILAELTLITGDTVAAARLGRASIATARSLGHHRALRQAEELLARCGADGSDEDFLLTNRESQILERLARGQSNAAIAEELNFSLSTIRRDISLLYQKLGAAGRPDAVRIAIANGLIVPNDR